MHINVHQSKNCQTVCQWANLRLNRHHTCDQYPQFLASFTRAGYLPHRADPGLAPVTVDTHTDWFDVIWIHSTAVPIPV